MNFPGFLFLFQVYFYNQNEDHKDCGLQFERKSLSLLGPQVPQFKRKFLIVLMLSAQPQQLFAQYRYKF